MLYIMLNPWPLASDVIGVNVGTYHMLTLKTGNRPTADLLPKVDDARRQAVHIFAV